MKFWHKMFFGISLRQPDQITCGLIMHTGVMLFICNFGINIGVYMIKYPDLQADLSCFPFLPVLQPIAVLLPLLCPDSTPQKTQVKNWAQHIFSLKQSKIPALLKFLALKVVGFHQIYFFAGVSTWNFNQTFNEFPFCSPLPFTSR